MFKNHWNCVFRSTFVYLHALFATYALKWKDYHLTLISSGIWAALYLSFVMLQFRKIQQGSYQSKNIKQEHQHRQGKPEYLLSS